MSGLQKIAVVSSVFTGDGGLASWLGTHQEKLRLFGSRAVSLSPVRLVTWPLSLGLIQVPRLQTFADTLQKAYFRRNSICLAFIYVYINVSYLSGLR